MARQQEHYPQSCQVPDDARKSKLLVAVEMELSEGAQPTGYRWQRPQPRAVQPQNLRTHQQNKKATTKNGRGRRRAKKERKKEKRKKRKKGKKERKRKEKERKKERKKERNMEKEKERKKGE